MVGEVWRRGYPYDQYAHSFRPGDFAPTLPHTHEVFYGF